MAFRTQDDLRGEVAVVTGASRGLGLLLARELARQGRLDIVVSNAGIIQVGPVQAATPEHFESALD